ncbi:hypothetical protein OSB04_031157 [Centaurea solstitialis]|uniref:Hydroxyproline-rich glycoprotein family protein n=1 Tax=Centaurea solstitialis TaxID=347529 RepID=A0AA38S8F4_9ASTR|nr:hypothetical protein OSB04_031157 [Centaurea solstitialis]
MRGSKRGRISMEKDDKVDKVKEEPRLSGAYIRSLVKQLTSARTKLPVNGEDGRLPKVLNTNGDCFPDANSISMQQESPLPLPSPSPKPQQKKQVRRRQHTTRPYQERLLNMAEARKEIVTALKFHRASMKQQQAPPNNQPLRQESATNNNYSGPYDNWPIPISTIAPPPPPSVYHQNLNIKLPNQTLASSSSSSSSSSATVSVATEEVAVANSLHHAMDDEEMEEIRSLGEQHQMEWNDSVNLVMSARWFEFLKTMEIGPNKKDDYGGFNPFDEVIEFPHWSINSNEQHFSDDCLQDQDPALPCMEIGEIDGGCLSLKQD